MSYFSRAIYVCTGHCCVEEGCIGLRVWYFLSKAYILEIPALFYLQLILGQCFSHSLHNASQNYVSSCNSPHLPLTVNVFLTPYTQLSQD